MKTNIHAETQEAQWTYKKVLVSVDCQLIDSWPAVSLKAETSFWFIWHTAKKQQLPVDFSWVINIKYRTVLCNMCLWLHIYLSIQQN